MIAAVLIVGGLAISLSLLLALALYLTLNKGTLNREGGWDDSGDFDGRIMWDYHENNL